MTDPTPAAAPPRAVRFAAPLLLLAAVAALAAAVFLPPPGRRAAVPPPTLADGPAPVVPAFSLTERSGKAVTNADLLGKVWVASFVFTRCNGPCPSVTATVARLQADLKLADEPNLRLVTFTVDPERDRPDDLKKYAANFRADPDRWLFLTGPEKELHALLHDGFKIAAARSENPNPPEGQEFDHSTFLVLVDKAGKVRGYFDGWQGPNDENGEKFAASYARLRAEAAKLLAE